MSEEKKYTHINEVLVALSLLIGIISVFLTIRVATTVNAENIQTEIPRIEPSSLSVLPGGTVTFHGYHFVPHEIIEIKRDETALFQTKVGPDGSFATKPIPVTYTSGLQTYTAYSIESHREAKRVISIPQLKPKLYLNSYKIKQRSPITISGQFFGAGEAVSLSIRNIDLGVTKTTPEGTLHFETSTPKLPYGKQIITAISQKTQVSSTIPLVIRP